jgi:hypothetical protein
MRRFTIAGPCSAAAALFLVATGLAQPAGPQPVAVAEDGTATVNGVDVACTGVGQTREDPRWLAYPVRVEVSDAQDQYLAGAIVSVFDKAGHPLLSVTCDDPWVLLKLKPAVYRVHASLMAEAAKPRSATIKAPASGQIRVVLQFTDVNAPPAPTPSGSAPGASSAPRP